MHLAACGRHALSSFVSPSDELGVNQSQKYDHKVLPLAATEAGAEQLQEVV